MKRKAGPPALEVDVVREAGGWPAEDALAALAERAVAAAVARASPGLPRGAEVAAIFTDDARIRALNSQYRGKDSPTNVLSFPAGPPRAGIPGPLLGDIVLAFETVAAEAADRGLDFDSHAIHLIVHGFLHLLGHNHEIEQEAVVMEGLETLIMEDLGLHDPYAA